MEKDTTVVCTKCGAEMLTVKKGVDFNSAKKLWEDLILATPRKNYEDRVVRLEQSVIKGEVDLQKQDI